MRILLIKNVVCDMEEECVLLSVILVFICPHINDGTQVIIKVSVVSR